jgi:PadR family transcriptional regulator AphA
MGASTISVRYFILNLLTQQPMSGYDVKRFLKRFSWLIGSPSFGSLYPALRALLHDGLVTVEVIPREDKPPRKIYSITETGREALQEWIRQPVAPDVPLKTFVMRLMVAGNLPHAALVEHLEQRRSQITAHQIDLRQTATAMDDGADLGQCLALGYGLAVANAELTWLDRTLVQLSSQQNGAASHLNSESVSAR